MRGRFRSVRVGLLPAVLAAGLGGCAGDFGSALLAPASVPPGAPRVTGLDTKAEREHRSLVAGFGGEYRLPAARTLLSEITARLVKATDRPDEAYEITLLNSPVVNAFALPNGRLYVTRGLLALANDTAEVAGVLAHEIAHVTLRHASARSEHELRSALVSRVVSDVLGDPNASAMVLNQSRFSLASFSRAQELEADQIGVRTLMRAGYDPYGAARFLTSLGRAAGGKNEVDGLSSHPSTPERIAQAQKAARIAGAPGMGDSDRVRYLAAIDGVVFGDDPTDGVIRGRRFIHARLGVAFEAPPGLSLENTARAVVGASPDGSRRLLFDALEAPADRNLADVLRTSWSDAIETGSIETTTINGLPAAMASSKGKDWAFRLAAIRIDSTVYRLVYATRRADAEMEQAFRTALGSVRAVGPDEARRVSPLRLQVVTAGPEDTVESLGGRMAVTDKPVERFRVLNGLEADAKLQPGGRYKLVVE